MSLYLNVALVIQEGSVEEERLIGEGLELACPVVANKINAVFPASEGI